MLSKTSTLFAIAALVLVGSPLAAFAQATNAASENISKTGDAHNSVIQQGEEEFSGTVDARRNRSQKK